MDEFDYNKIDYLPTEERRKYARQLKKYAKFFRMKIEKIEKKSAKDKVVDMLPVGLNEKKKKENKFWDGIQKYNALLSRLVIRCNEAYMEQTGDATGISDKDAKEQNFAGLSGASASNIGLGGLVLGGGGVAEGISLLADLRGLSDKQQAIIYRKAFETAMGLLRESDVSEEKIRSALNRTMSKISDIKERYSEIDDDDELAKRIQDECVIEITEGIEQTSDYNKFQRHIEKTIGNSAWNKMTQNAQIFVITGELLFDQWKIYGEDIDFAPICMSVSKALEVEVTRRYFVGYLNYLKDKKEQLPAELLIRDNGILREKTEEEFMLGNITGITGYAVYLDSNTTKLVGKLIDENQKFIRYAKSELFKGKRESECVQLIKKHVYNIKKVCVQYRNPSAHKKKVTKISARECLDYMVDVKKVMGEMLDDCAW